MFQLGLAFSTAAAMELAEETNRDPLTITPAELDGQLLKLAAESELIFEMVAFIRLRNACFGIVDSKNAGEFGNFSLYLELLPIMQRMRKDATKKKRINSLNDKLTGEISVHFAHIRLKIKEDLTRLRRTAPRGIREQRVKGL